VGKAFQTDLREWEVAMDGKWGLAGPKVWTTGKGRGKIYSWPKTFCPSCSTDKLSLGEYDDIELRGRSSFWN